MKLVTGGAYQGKKAYALETYQITEWSDGANCPFEELFTCPGMDHFHEYIRRALKENREISGLAGELTARNPKIVLITDELGCGVVPVDPFDRAYREAHGRLCCQLAAEAEEVVRVICGIGMVIRHA